MNSPDNNYYQNNYNDAMKYDYPRNRSKINLQDNINVR